MSNSFNSWLIVFVVYFIGFLNMAVAQSGQPSEYPDHIVLNATPEPSTSVAVTWRTSTQVTEGFCEFQPGSDTKIGSAKTVAVKALMKTCEFGNPNETKISVNVYSVVLKGLAPGAKYLYRVGSGNFWSEWFEIEMPDLDVKKDFSFIYFGDPQLALKSEWSGVVRKSYQMVPDCRFMLYAGDIINRSGSESEWNEWFTAGSYLFSVVPQLMTPGNHDYSNLKIDKHWNTQFTQPQNGPNGLKGTCYYIDYPNLRLISIDSAAGSELENESGYEMTVQKAWLDSVLRTNTKKWTILTTHLPFYSTKDTRDNPQLRKHFQPILEKYKVDLVLTGHDHAYGRGRVSDNPNVKPSIVYVVSVSGPKLYPEGTKAWMEKRGGNTQLFQKITITGNKLVYKSFTASGNLFDTFSIQKMDSGKKKFK